MRERELCILSNMCMVYSGKKAVALNRVDKNWGGITFPGGHVEKGESFTEAVIREVYEETGLTIESPELCGIKDWPLENGGRYIVFFYKTNKFKGELKSSEEGEVFWADINSLHTMPLASDMEDMINIFLRDDLSELYYYREGSEWKYELK